nr:MAG TPA: head to tail adaptor [Caudoviricetes sp.]
MGKSNYSREYILEMIVEYGKAERAVLTGKSYKIGTRELTRMSIEEIRKGRAYWESELQNLESRGSRRVRRGVPRNL